MNIGAIAFIVLGIFYRLVRHQPIVPIVGETPTDNTDSW
jgi:hypothetical protein